MTATAALRGMTWDHSRGHDPMVATSRRYSEINPGVEITWDRRPLQAFADRPVQEMAREYDLIVIDHPHVGEVAKDGSLVALDLVGRDVQMAELEENSVGESHHSYNFDGHQWALAIDAATPVAAYREDLLSEPPSDWTDVLELARRRRVAFGLIPINALMTFMGLARNLGHSVAEGESFIDPEAGRFVLETIREMTALMDPECLNLDPIGIFDWMGGTEDGPVYSPFGYGYTNYSRPGFCRFPVTFADAPGIDGNGPRGTVLGGAGISVSNASRHREVAIDYAFWLAGADCQAGLYFDAGGQPGHTAAWDSDACNHASGNFFRNTRRTLETAWVRPRHPGYMRLQDRAGGIVHACLRGDLGIEVAIAQLQGAFQLSLEGWHPTGNGAAGTRYSGSTT